MDFFQAQDDARRKTKRLVFYFLVAVALIVLAVYFAVTAGFVAYHHWAYRSGAGFSALDWVPLWDAKRFLITASAVVLLIGTGSLFKTLSLRGGGAAVALSLGGERVDRSTRDPARRQLLNVVEEMAIASGVPVPGVFVLVHEPAINAFAAGWGMDDAVVAVSAGALERLSRDELQGVVAHEYSHILYGDCRLNIRLMGILFGIMMLTAFGRMIGSLLRGGSGRRGGTVIYAGGGRRRGGNGKGGGGALILAVILVIVLITVIGYIGTFFGRLIQAAISRQREFLADAAAVQFTRNPEGIAGALKHIAVEDGRGVMRDPHASEAAHMFFADGLKRSFSTALATHPPLPERIRKVQPDWDGSLPKRRKRRTARHEVEAPSASGGARQASGRKMIEAMTILGAVGTLGPGGLPKGRALREAIPVELDIRMRQSEGARQVILALVIADNSADDDRQMDILGESLEEGECAAVRECIPLIRELSREVRLTVLELATTTLRQSALTDADEWIALIDRLAGADDRLSLYEFCVRRILRERLKGGQAPDGSASGVSYMRLDPDLAAAVGNLLSVVARDASGADKPEEALERSLRGLYLLEGKIAYETAADGGIDALDASLDRLNAAAYAIRAQCLRAAVACVRDDGQLSPEEAELIRALSLGLACPLPPLGS